LPSAAGPLRKYLAVATITDLLEQGVPLEVAQQMAAHESARTTGLYDRRGDEISLDEVVRILI
jgi:site-specific recombinase XerD